MSNNNKAKTKTNTTPNNNNNNNNNNSNNRREIDIKPFPFLQQINQELSNIDSQDITDKRKEISDKLSQPFVRKSTPNNELVEKLKNVTDDTKSIYSSYKKHKDALLNSVEDEAEEYHNLKPTTITTEDKPSQYEFVDHPQHYKKNSDDIETIEKMIRIWGKDTIALWCTITAFKYRDRIGLKPTEPVDREIQKIKWYENKANELKNS